jgi:hypothetical protein
VREEGGAIWGFLERNRYHTLLRENSSEVFEFFQRAGISNLPALEQRTGDRRSTEYDPSGVIPIARKHQKALDAPIPPASARYARETPANPWHQASAKSRKKRLHNRPTAHYKSAYEYGSPLYFTRRPGRMCLGKLAA